MSAKRVAGAAEGARSRMLLVLVMQCAIVLLCVTVTTLFALWAQERSLRDATVDRVLDVARSLAELDQVIDGVAAPRAEATARLQPLADLVASASGVDYVVITDADGIRLTHPTPSERGRPVSTDPTDVLAGGIFVGTETGTIGPTLRAKVPVRDGDRVVGTASVGILESKIVADFTSITTSVLPWVAGSVVVGCLASAGVTMLVRARMRRLEGEARELQEQRRLAAALRDQTHEFHTRLHVIRGLVAEGETAAALDYVADIVPVASVAVAGARLDDGKAQAVVDGAAAMATARGVVVEVDSASEVLPDAMHDDDLLVLSNLCRNAVEAAAGRVHVMVRADEAGTRIVVADDGRGVDPSQVLRLFERGATSKGAGRGVGLDLVRRVVASRGGSVEVGSSRWGGALFCVDMPLRADGEGAARGDR